MTRQGTLNGEDVTRSGADKAKGGHDIDDKGRDKGSADSVASGDVTRSRKRGDAEAAWVRIRLGEALDVTRRHVTGRDAIRRDVIGGT